MLTTLTLFLNLKRKFCDKIISQVLKLANHNGLHKLLIEIFSDVNFPGYNILLSCRGYDAQNKKEYLFYTEKHGSGDKKVNWLHRRITQSGYTEGMYISVSAHLLVNCFVVHCSVG